MLSRSLLFLQMNMDLRASRVSDCDSLIRQVEKHRLYINALGSIPVLPNRRRSLMIGLYTYTKIRHSAEHIKTPAALRRSWLYTLS
jgi:hypothetical protein